LLDDADRQLLYSVNEGAQGELVHYSYAVGQSFEEISRVASGGASPCHLQISPDKKFLGVANYMGGNVGIFRLNSKGGIESAPQILQHSGTGPNTSRQEGPHAHWVSWDKKQENIYVVDLGIDQIKRYPFDIASGSVSAAKTALMLQPGDGPRHMVFHPNKPYAYVLNELSNTLLFTTVTAEGDLKVVQRLTTLPVSYAEHNQTSHIEINSAGTVVYISNRGHNSIAVFSIAESGKLTAIDHEPTQGHWPRHFKLLERFRLLLVGNQEGDNITVLKIEANGSLSATGVSIELPQVTYIGVLGESKYSQEAQPFMGY